MEFRSRSSTLRAIYSRNGPNDDSFRLEASVIGRLRIFHLVRPGQTAFSCTQCGTSAASEARRIQHWAR